jgi:hypothetical protein
MNLEKHRLEQAERLVVVEEGVKQIVASLEACKLPAMKEDIKSLKGTQKWVRWFAKTSIGALILSVAGYFLV